MNAWIKVKTVTGYAAQSRLLSEIPEQGIGWIRDCDKPASTPYSYGPSRQVVDWRGEPAVLLETAHRRYELWRVPAHVEIFSTDDAATEAHITEGR